MLFHNRDRCYVIAFRYMYQGVEDNCYKCDNINIIMFFTAA